jgi:hypothetical protein
MFEEFGKFTMKLLINVIILIHFFPLFIHAAETQGIALLKGIEKQLNQCDSFHLEYTIHYGENDIAGRFMSKHKIIVNFSKNNMLVKKSSEDVKIQQIFMKVNDEVYENITGQNNVRVFDVGKASERATPVYDPRIMHLIELWAADTTISDCLLYKRYDSLKSEKRNINGNDLWVVTIHKPTDDGETVWELWIEEPSFHLLKTTCTTGYGMKYSIENTYADKTAPFPQRTHIYREENGKVLFDREIHKTLFKKVDSFPKDFFSLKNMDLPINIPVSDLRIMKRIGYWDGEKLSPQPVSTNEGTEIQPVYFGIFRIILIVSGLVLIGLAIFLQFCKKKSI